VVAGRSRANGAPAAAPPVGVTVQAIRLLPIAGTAPAAVAPSLPARPAAAGVPEGQPRPPTAPERRSAPMGPVPAPTPPRVESGGPSGPSLDAALPFGRPLIGVVGSILRARWTSVSLFARNHGDPATPPRGPPAPQPLAPAPTSGTGSSAPLPSGPGGQPLPPSASAVLAAGWSGPSFAVRRARDHLVVRVPAGIAQSIVVPPG
jgi:hypothetical protein